MARARAGGVKRWLVIALVIVCLIGVGALIYRERVVLPERLMQLDASSAAERKEAREYWFDGNLSEAGRLSNRQNLLDLLDERSGGFSDAALAEMFDDVIRPREEDWFTLGRSAPMTFYRSIIAAMERSGRDGDLRHDALMKLDLALQNGMRRTTNGLEYGIVWEVADLEERELIVETLLAINGAAAADPEAGPANIGTLTAISVTGAMGLRALEPMLDAVNDTARREAWLQLAVLRPESGYSARWQDAPRGVGEAMIAASVVMSGDAGGTIERFRADERVSTEFSDVLDALELLARDDEGRVKLGGMDWSQPGADAVILRDLSNAHDQVSGSQWRFRSLRNRSGLADDQ